MPIAIEQSVKRGSETAMNSGSDSVPRPISRARAWEESWPYLLGFGAAIVYGATGGGLRVSPNLLEVFSSVVSIAGLFAAFFLASASILVTLSDSWFKRRAIESGVYFALIGYMLTAMGWNIATAVFTTAAMFFDSAWHLWWYHYALTVWCFLLMTTLGVSLRVLRIFAVLMKYIARH